MIVNDGKKIMINIIYTRMMGVSIVMGVPIFYRWMVYFMENPNEKK